jgi:hypothetical protein
VDSFFGQFQVDDDTQLRSAQARMQTSNGTMIENPWYVHALRVDDYDLINREVHSHDRIDPECPADCPH